MLVRLTPLTVLGWLAAGAGAHAQPAEINIYTYREAKLIQPLFDAFTKDTGVKVNVVSASSGLEQRIKSEGDNSPADVLLTVDIGRLEEAVAQGITQPIKSPCSTSSCPPNTAIRKAIGTACRCARAWSMPRRSAYRRPH
jgi:iron(III) transport system substrate-binding protein